MSSEALDDVARAILDGTPVDWNTLSSTGDIEARGLAEQLKILAAVGEVHRTDATPRPPATSSTPPGDAEGIGRWGHLRLLEPIGAGAFGEVYRAWDTRLDREVALKLMPAGVAPDAGDASPGIHEGRLLARVRHPHVVTIYGAERIGNRIGLWMELVRGETLDQIVSHGRIFTAAETMDVGVTLSSALSAVHAAGLLHRDIKAHNVMRTGEGRLVLMDFGAGREFEDRSAPDAPGTPLYLAPEVFLGAPATVASDIYSLGVLLFRLVTGRYPVRGRSVRELRDAHTRGDRVRVREARPGLDRGLARVIERAIDPVPERRYQTADAIGADLFTLQRRARRRPIVYAAGAVAALAVIGMLTWSSLDRGAVSPAAVTATSASAPPAAATAAPNATTPAPVTTTPGGETPTPSNTVAAVPADGPAPPPVLTRQPGLRLSVEVLPFENATGLRGESWLSAALAEMVLREFRAAETFRWIPGAIPRAKALLGQAMPSESSLTNRLVVPPDVVVSGEFTMQAPPRDLRVTVRLQDSAQRRILATFVEAGATTDIVELVARIGARARAALGDQSTPDRTVVNRSQPGNADAARWFSEGLGKLLPEAVESFERAVAADPDFAPAHIALAEAVLFRGLDAGRPRAQALAARALELAKDLPREERLQIEIRAAAMAGGAGFRERTLPAFEKLFELFPDTLQYGFEVALLQVRTDANLALTTIGKISLLPGAAEHFRLHMLEAEASGATKDFERASRALAQALKVAEALGDGVAMGDVMLDQARVASDRGDPVTALGVAENARRQHALGRPGYFLHSIANSTVHEIWARAGGVAWARRTYDQLIAAARSRGDRATEGHLRCGLALLLAEHGELAASREQLEMVAREWTGLDAPRFNPQMGLAIVQFRQGELARAREGFSVALDAATPLLPPGGQPDRFDRDRRLALREIAEVQLIQGDLAAARDNASSTLAPDRRDPWQESHVHALLARVALAQGDLQSAKRSADAAGTPTSAFYRIQPVAVDALLTRALVALDDGRPGDARSLAQQAAREAERDLLPASELSAAIVMTLGWLGEGKIADAQTAIAPVTERIQKSQDFLLRLSGGIAIARVQAASGAPANLVIARQQLERIHREAADLGAVGLRFDAALALGEIDMRSGNFAAGRARLSALEREASAKGYQGIAAKASALMK